jgi:hypothetical protein
MEIENRTWKKLFMVCFGLFAGTAFCMKWMEGDFIQNGEKFTIIGLELSYSKEKIVQILSGLDNKVKTILQYHLYFDFAFMAGVYPGIAALCMMARQKTRRINLKKILLLAALLQLPAWGFDILENSYLLKWINNPVISENFSIYHIIVITKWTLALLAAIISIPLVLKRDLKK